MGAGLLWSGQGLLIEELHLVPVPFCSLPLLPLFVVAWLFYGATSHGGWVGSLSDSCLCSAPTSFQSVCWGSRAAQPRSILAPKAPQ